MNRQCALIGVEGPHDQAFLAKIFRKSLGFSEFNGEESKLEEKIWQKFIPKYPVKGRLYSRLDMPTILHNDTVSVAIYSGEGSNLISNLSTKLADIDCSTLLAFGIIADADNETTNKVAERYSEGFRELFPDFPTTVTATGTVIEDSPRIGLYILPNNADQGVLDNILCDCGDIAYPEYMKRARDYINQFSGEEINKKPLKWKPFDNKKALVATVVSVLKPGKTNQTSIKDNDWISNDTLQQLPELQNLTKFLSNLLNLPNNP